MWLTIWAISCARFAAGYNVVGIYLEAYRIRDLYSWIYVKKSRLIGLDWIPCSLHWSLFCLHWSPFCLHWLSLLMWFKFVSISSNDQDWKFGFYCQPFTQGSTTEKLLCCEQWLHQIWQQSPCINLSSKDATQRNGSCSFSMKLANFFDCYGPKNIFS